MQVSVTLVFNSPLMFIILRFDSLPSATNDDHGQRTVRISTTRAHGSTVALSYGRWYKLTPLVIFKEKNGELGPRVSAALRPPENVDITATINGWMTRKKLHSWLVQVWGENKYSERRLLVLDRHRPQNQGWISLVAEGTEANLMVVNISDLYVVVEHLCYTNLH